MLKHYHKRETTNLRDTNGKLVVPSGMSMSRAKAADKQARAQKLTQTSKLGRVTSTSMAAHERSEAPLDRSNLMPKPTTSNAPELSAGDRVMLKKISTGRNEYLPYGRCCGTVIETYRQHGVVMALVKLDRTTRYGGMHIKLRRAVEDMVQIMPGERSPPAPVDNRPEHWSCYASVLG